MRTRYKFFVGLTTAVAVPLLASGVFLEVIAVQKAFDDQGLSVLTYMLLGMSLCAIAVSLPFLAVRASQSGSRLDDLREQHPDEPWLWREDWKKQLLRCGSEFPFGPLFVAALWNVATIGLGLLLFEDWLAESDPVKWAVLILPLVGIGLVIYAIRTFLLWYRFGETRFVLGNLPVPAGGLVEGIAYTSIPLENNPERGFKVSLSCVNEKVRLDRMARTKRSYLLWRDEQRFKGVNSLDDESQVVIPLYFRLPEDCSETSLQSNDRVTWMLKIEGETPRGAYVSRFTLPVFCDASADERIVEWTDSRSHSAVRYTPQPVTSGLEVIGAGIEVDSANDGGGSTIHLRRARNRALAMLVGLVTAVWWTMTAVLFAKDAPIYFSVLCSLAGAMAIYGSAVLLTFESTIKVTRGMISVRRGPFGKGKLHEYPTINADRLEVETGSRSGGAYLHNIVLRDRLGERFLIADQISDKSIAEWLVLKIQSDITGGYFAYNGEASRSARKDRASRRRLTSLNDRVNERISIDTTRLN